MAKKKTTSKRATSKKAASKRTAPGRSSASETAKLAKKLGVAESTIRARKARGQDIEAKRQVRLTPAQMKQAARARGDAEEVAAKFGCSPSTIRRLRRLRAAEQGGASKKKK